MLPIGNVCLGVVRYARKMNEIKDIVLLLIAQWEVIKSAWVFVLLFGIGLVFVAVYGTAAFFRERIAVKDANIAFLGTRLDANKSEIAGLREQTKDAQSGAKDLPPAKLSAVVYGDEATQELFDHLARGGSIELEFSPTESKEWKHVVWKLSPDKFARFAAARALIEEGFADIKPESGGGYRLTGTNTASSLRFDFEKWRRAMHPAHAPKERG